MIIPKSPMSVGETLNEFIKQFNMQYNDKDMDRPATIDDILAMVHIATMIGRAFLDYEEQNG